MKIIVATISIALFSTILYSMDKQQNNHALAFPEINVSAIQQFLDEGGNPNIQNNSGYTPLYCAIVLDNIECTELLLKNGANPDIQFSELKETLLHTLVRASNIKYIQLLLNYNANPDIPNYCSSTPLHELGLLPENNISMSICKLLIEYSKDPFAKNKYDLSPYDIISKKYKPLLTKSSIQKIKQQKLIRIKEEPKLQKLQIEHERLKTLLTNHPIEPSPANLAMLQSIRHDQTSRNRNTKSSICLVS